MGQYKVQLDVYNGPLDLLLYLIRREELDIYDIPIARIAQQYMEYVGLLRSLDPESAADFLVLAATLMEIKSRMLLPRAPVEGEEEEDFEDPRLDLVRQLLQYKTFKDAAFVLGTLKEDHAKRFQRQPGAPPTEEKVFDLEEAQTWDLFTAFSQLMSQVGYTPTAHEVLYDDTPISLHATDIQDRLLREGGSLLFEAIFEGRSRSEMVGLFLAILELARQKRIRAEQERPFGPIYVHLVDATPITEDSVTALGEGAVEADEADEEEDEEDYPREPAAEASEEDLQDRESVEKELAEFDRSLAQIATEVDEEKQKLVEKIDRLMDVEAELDSLPSRSQQTGSEEAEPEETASEASDPAPGEAHEVVANENPGEDE